MVEYSNMEYGGIRRSFAVEYVALGFLIESSMHGYELRERLSAGLGTVWRVAASQLYNVLGRLERKGLVTRRVEPQEGRPSRNVYAVTPKGEQAFWSWVVSPVRHLRDVRVEFLAKVYLLRRLAPERVPALVDAEIESLTRLKGHLARKGRIESDDRSFGRFALRFRQSQIENTIQWLTDSRAQLTQP